MPRLRNGMARVEFLAVRIEAEALLAKGHPCTAIYERFHDDGKITMSYRTFCCHLKGAPRKKTKQGDPPEKKPVSLPAVVSKATPVSDVKPNNGSPSSRVESEGPRIIRPETRVEFGKEKFDMDELI